MRTHLTRTTERTQRRVLGPADYPDLQRALERAASHGLSARRTPGLAADHWLVESHSDPTLLHTVIVTAAGDQLVASCDCIGWASLRICTHVAVAMQTAQLGPWHAPVDVDPILRIMEYDLREAHGMLAHAFRMGDPVIIASCRREIERTEQAIIRERALRSVVRA